MSRLRFGINATVLLVPIGLLGVQSIRFVRGVWTYLNTGARLAGVASVEATRALGREVRVGDVKIRGNLWSLNASNRIELLNVDVAEGAALSAGRFAHVDAARVWYNLKQTVLSSDPRVPLVSEVQLIGPRVLLVRDAQGMWNFQQLLKKQPGTGRRFTDKFSFENGTLDYYDQAFPHPPAVPARPLATTLDHLNGVLLFRPDKSVAFDVAGTGSRAIVQQFKVTGVVQPTTQQIVARLNASQVYLPFVAARFVPSKQATLSTGQADLGANLFYAPRPNLPPNTLDPTAVSAQGTLHLAQVALRTPRLSLPVTSVNGDLTFTSDALTGTLAGQYGATGFTLNGKAVGFTRLQPTDSGVPRLVVQTPTLSVQGALTHADLSPILRDLQVAQRSPLLDQIRGQGNLQFQINGSPDNPTAIGSAHLNSLQERSLDASNVDAHAFLDNRILNTDLRARLNHGDIALKGKVALDSSGAFQVEGHARNLPLAPIGDLLHKPLGGTGKLDLALRGQRGFTPNISAQMQLSNLKLNNQTLQSVYARAATVRRDLTLRTLRVEDPKGVALANGTLNLSTQKLHLNVAANELDLGKLIQAFPLHNSLGINPALKTVGEPAPLFDPEELQGVGYLQATVGGSIRQPEAKGEFSAYAVQAGRAGLDKVKSAFTLSGKALTLADGLALRYPGTVAFHGAITGLRKPQPAVNLVAQVHNFDLADLIRLAQAPTVSPVTSEPFVLTGKLSTDSIVVAGTPRKITVPHPVTVALDDVTVNGLPVTKAFATARLTKTGGELIAAHAQFADGTLSAAGRFGRKGELAISLSAENINAERILDVLPERLGESDLTSLKDTDLQGKLNLHADLRGSVHAPQIDADLQGAGLTYNDYPIGDVKAAAHYGDRSVNVASFALLDPNRLPSHPGDLRLSGLVYYLDTQALSGQASWSGLKFTRLRDLFLRTPLAQSESGQSVNSALTRFTNLQDATIAGTLTLGGTLSTPQADVTLDAQNVEIVQQRFDAFGGSARITKTELLIPAPNTPARIIRLSSGNSTLVVPRASVEYDGPLDAELSAYNFNFGFLRALDIRRRTLNSAGLGSLWRYLRPDASETLGGEGDLFVLASGQTRSPILDASINLRNFGPVGQTIDRLDVSRITAQEGKIEADGIELVKTAIGKENKPVRFTGKMAGSIGFSWKPPYIAGDAPIMLEASLPEQPIVSLTAFKPNAPLDSDGVFSVQASVRNRLDDPRVTGAIAFRAGKLQFGRFQTGLRDLNGVFDFEQDRLVARQGFTARSQVFRSDEKAQRETGQSIYLTGSLPLTGRGAQDSPGMTLRTQSFLFDEKNTPVGGGLAASAHGIAALNLSITGSLLDPIVGGEIGISDAVISPPGQANANTGPPFVPPVNPELNLRVLLGNNVRLVRPGVSAGIDARADGEITIKGKLIDPQDRLTVARDEARDTTDQTAVAEVGPVDSSGEDVVSSGPRPGVRVYGKLNVRDGRLTLPTARFRILPPGSVTLTYPSVDEANPDVPALGINVDLKAQTALTATSQSGTRKRYQVTVTAVGPLTGATDPISGQSRLALNVATDPPDFAGSQTAMQQRLAGVLGTDALSGFGANPGQVLAQQFTNIFTSSVLPTIFDRPAEALGFEELSINYDPVQRLNLVLSRRLFGPLYVSYNRGLSGGQEMYNLKFSFRFTDRVQLSYDQDEQNTHRILLESVFHF